MQKTTETTTHPLYEKARAAWQKQQGTPYPASRVYLTTAEVASLLRQRLKHDFPQTKFSVRSSQYSGGSSVDVRWTDGPWPTEVEPIANGYQFSAFDSSIDLKISSDYWLLPNGSLVFASTPGTEGSRGSLPAATYDAPTPAAVKVGGGPDFVFCRREVSSPAHCHVDHDRIPYGGPCPVCRTPVSRPSCY